MIFAPFLLRSLGLAGHGTFPPFVQLDVI